jgi:hypothetical protein
MISGMKKSARLCLTAAAIIAPAMLSGCNEDDYLARRDTVSLGAGDAIATNAVTQTIDPWNRNAKNTDIQLDGERAGVAIDRYQQNKSIPPKGVNISKIAGQPGPGAPASPQVKN